MRVVFFGSPEFAVPTLEALLADPAFEVALVVAQGHATAAPVAQAARAAGLPVYQPASLRDQVSRQPLVAAAADLFVVAAFGLIFRNSMLAIPRLGSVNVHPSLLPAYRGASPIAAAISTGEKRTGVSLMVMDAGIDTGAVISCDVADVADDDTTESLGNRLGRIGASLATRDIPRWAAGELMPRPQTLLGATLTRPMTKADGLIDWTRPAPEIERHVRAMWPWPRAWTTLDGALLQVHSARLATVKANGLGPGFVVPDRRRIVVACGSGALELLTIEPAGRRAMTAQAFLNGRRSPVVRFAAGGSPVERPPLVIPVAAAG